MFLFLFPSSLTISTLLSAWNGHINWRCWAKLLAPNSFIFTSNILCATFYCSLKCQLNHSSMFLDAEQCWALYKGIFSKMQKTIINHIFKTFLILVCRLIFSTGTRVGPIYRLADIFGRYRYRYIGIRKLDIGIGHICICICIGYSGYRLYRYQATIG